MIRVIWATLIVLCPVAAQASEVPLYKPAPDWAKPAPAPTAAGDAPGTAILDSQVRLADGTVWRYAEVAFRAVSAQALAKLGTVRLNWQPAHGDLIIHRVDIVRGAERIDVLKSGARFQVLRREQRLDALQIDGVLTAILPVEGLRVGDVLDVSYSITNHDPTLKGQVAAGALLPAQPLAVGFGRTRVLWPMKDAIKWKIYAEGVMPTATDAGGWHELSFTLPVARQPDPPASAPRRYYLPPVIDVSSFADWSAVASVMEPLYRTEGLIAPGSPLAAEVDRIAAATSDPRHRVALALALVQEKVRYLFNGLDNGNYVPQSPAATWTARFGDCKAKTLLLLAVLHALRIDAEPALAQLQNGDGVADRLPSPGAFNHIFVIAKIGDDTLWLDGTGNGTQFEDLADVYPYGWVLPLKARGAALVKAPTHAPARPTTETAVVIDQRAGISLPGSINATVTLRGAQVGSLRSQIANLNKEQRDQLLAGTISKLGPAFEVFDSSVSFDDAAPIATVKLNGVYRPAWRYVDNRYRFSFANSGGIAPLPDRARAAWQDVPVLATGPSNQVASITMLLPDDGKGFSVDGAPSVDVSLPDGRHIVRTARLQGAKLTLEEHNTATGGELAPADFAATRANIAQFSRQRVDLQSAAGYPGPWTRVAAAKAAHRFDDLLAGYAAKIAEKPDDAARYLHRAQVLTLLFERDKALADLDKAVALDGSATTLAARATLLDALGRHDKAAADLDAALALNPGDAGLASRLARARADLGDRTGALAVAQARIDQGGADKATYIGIKASALARLGDRDAALAAIDEALTDKPNDASLLNQRCWLRGTLNAALDGALKDCTKAIELSDSVAPLALDSRAMVFLRMDRLPDALADLNSALDRRPSAAGSLFLRGILSRRNNQAAAGDADLAAARLLDPQIDKTYARYGIRP